MLPLPCSEDSTLFSIQSRSGYPLTPNFNTLFHFVINDEVMQGDIIKLTSSWAWKPTCTEKPFTVADMNGVIYHVKSNYKRCCGLLICAEESCSFSMRPNVEQATGPNVGKMKMYIIEFCLYLTENFSCRCRVHSAPLGRVECNAMIRIFRVYECIECFGTPISVTLAHSGTHSHAPPRRSIASLEELKKLSVVITANPNAGAEKLIAQHHVQNESKIYVNRDYVKNLRRQIMGGGQSFHDYGLLMTMEAINEEFPGSIISSSINPPTLHFSFSSPFMQRA